MQPPAGLVPSASFIIVEGHKGGIDCFKIFGEVGGRDRRCKRGEEKLSSPAFARPGEEDGKQCHQNGTVYNSLFLMSSG